MNRREAVTATFAGGIGIVLPTESLAQPTETKDEFQTLVEQAELVDLNQHVVKLGELSVGDTFYLLNCVSKHVIVSREEFDAQYAGNTKPDEWHENHVPVKNITENAYTYWWPDTKAYTQFEIACLDVATRINHYRERAMKKIAAAKAKGETT